MTINISLPFFVGFYDSYLYSGDNEAYLAQEESRYYLDDFGIEVEADDLVSNFEEYKQDCVSSFVEHFTAQLRDVIPSVNITNEQLWSPSYYNYCTDKVYADVELPDNFFSAVERELLDKEREFSFNQFLADRYADRSGVVWMFENSSAAEFIDGLKEGRKTDLYLEIIIEYLMVRDYYLRFWDKSKGADAYEIEARIAEEISMEVLENCYLTFSLPENLQEKVDAVIAARS